MWVPEERFSCRSCGRCCTRWTITVDAAKVEQLRKQDWGGPDPFLPRRGEGDPFRIRMVGGRCFFLAEDNRCRIHARLGYEAKPEGCKAFPLHAARVAGETYLRLSFSCPAVLAAEGKKLGEQQRWIKATLKAAGDIERKLPLQLDGSIEISARELESIEAALLTSLRQESLPVADRLAAGAGLIERLRSAVGEKGKAALAPALNQAGALDPLQLGGEARQAGSAGKGRAVLSLFLGQDRRPGALAGLGHFLGVRFFNLGLGRLRSQLLEGVAASRSAVRAIRFEPPAASRALLLRYLMHKLRSRRLLAGELHLQSGYALLVAAYAVCELLARTRAAAAGRAACDDDDVAAAVQAADLLVLEHTTLYQGSVVGALTEGVLAAPGTAASLLLALP